METARGSTGADPLGAPADISCVAGAAAMRRVFRSDTGSFRCSGAIGARETSRCDSIVRGATGRAGAAAMGAGIWALCSRAVTARTLVCSCSFHPLMPIASTSAAAIPVTHGAARHSRRGGATRFGTTPAGT